MTKVREIERFAQAITHQPGPSQHTPSPARSRAGKRKGADPTPITTLGLIGAGSIGGTVRRRPPAVTDR